MPSTDLKALSHPERVALVVLVKALVTADKQVSAEEAQSLSALARELGGDVMMAADRIKVAPDQLRSFLGTVTRQMARDIIYDTLLEMAKADDIQAEETALLDMVAEAWDVVVLESHE